MDRQGQMANVAFGGEWSEQIAPQEAMLEALDLLESAATRTGEEDLRADRALAAALDLATARHPKGEMLRHAWSRALDIPLPGVRAQEIARVASAIIVWAEGKG